MTDYTQHACPNPDCNFFNQFDGDNIAHRSWTGANKNIQRLRCKECKKEFSSRKGTLQEYAKISVEVQTIILKCLRWGVCEEGTAEIASVTRKTVRLFQKKAATRAKIHHNNEVHQLDDTSVQCDELYAKMSGSVTWIGTAISTTSLMIVELAFGKRRQTLADVLAVGIWARLLCVTMLLTDGWAPYYSAFLRTFGSIYQPRRKKGKGRRKAKRIKFRGDIFYGQVIKRAKQVSKRWHLKSVVIRSMIGSLEHCKFYIRAYGIGNTIHTSHVERWYGTLRSNLACLRRKSRCTLKLQDRLEEKTWIFASLYNWVIFNGSLTLNKVRRTPAMAAKLSEHRLSYQQYVMLRVFENPMVQAKINNKLEEIQSEEMVKASRRSEREPPDEEVLWEEEEKTETTDEEVA